MSINLCKYRNILGKPKQGIHSYRIFNIAIADVIMTIIGSYILSYIFKWPFWWTLFILFILGILLHKLFCVKTTINQLLFND
jgi:fatty acid desaturase